MEKKLPTTKELLQSYNEEKGNIDKLYFDDYLVGFANYVAKLHVTAALKEASEKATVTPIDHEEISEGSFRPIWGVDEESILNNYSLDNIK